MHSLGRVLYQLSYRGSSVGWDKSLTQIQSLASIIFSFTIPHDHKDPVSLGKNTLPQIRSNAHITEIHIYVHVHEHLILVRVKATLCMPVFVMCVCVCVCVCSGGGEVCRPVPVCGGGSGCAAGESGEE